MLILVVKHWLVKIFQLLRAQPWPFPLRLDLLSQAAGFVFSSCNFTKGARRLLPVSRSFVALWALAVVLEGLKGPPFEPLLGADLRFVSLKAGLLLALASAKCVSDIHVGAPVVCAVCRW